MKVPIIILINMFSTGPFKGYFLKALYNTKFKYLYNISFNNLWCVFVFYICLSLSLYIYIYIYIFFMVNLVQNDILFHVMHFIDYYKYYIFLLNILHNFVMCICFMINIILNANIVCIINFSFSSTLTELK